MKMTELIDKVIIAIIVALVVGNLMKEMK